MLINYSTPLDNIRGKVRVKLLTSMKVEPYVVARLISEHSKQWSVTGVTGCSETFIVGRRFYLKETGRETFYTFDLAATSFSKGQIKVCKYFLTNSGDNLSSLPEVKEFLILRNLVHNVQN